MAPAFIDHTSEHSNGRILIVDDETELTNALVDMLTKQNYQVLGFTDGNQALAVLKEEPFDVMMADLMMPAMDGITLLKAALQIDPNMVGIIMTGQGTVQTAVEAMKSGAFDYLMKPFKLSSVLTTLSKSLEVRRLRMENLQLRETVSIYELGQLVTSTLDPEVILQKTVEAVREQCQADDVSVLMPIPETDTFRAAAVYGEARAFLKDQIIPATGSITGWVAQNKEPLILKGAVDDERFVSNHPRPEVMNAVSLPMVLNHRLIGIINVNMLTHPHPLTSGQLRGLQTLINIAASAWENARLYQETEERLRRLNALRRIDLAIASSQDLDITLNIVLDQVVEQLDVDAAAVLLLDPVTERFTASALRGFRTNAVTSLSVRMGQGIAHLTTDEKQTIEMQMGDAWGEDPMLSLLPESEGFQYCAASPLITQGAALGILLVFKREAHVSVKNWISFLDALAGQTAIAVQAVKLYTNLQHTNHQLTMAYGETIEGWSRALDLRDQETEGHTQRVTEKALELARSMGLFTEDELIQIRRGALLHDIGKMGVPDHILLKPDKLNEEEEKIMREHPEVAYRLLAPITYLRRALDIPRYHHEWYDGTGYPCGLKGDQIPLAARVFAVVDVWDALSSDRPYRLGWSREQVLDYIRERSGTQFDPVVVEAFLRLGEKSG